jgi:hypothetical protein
MNICSFDKETEKLPIMSTSLKWALLVGSDSVHIREVLLYILQTELCVSLTKSHLWDEMNKISFTFDKILHKFRCFYYVHNELFITYMHVVNIFYTKNI